MNPPRRDFGVRNTETGQVDDFKVKYGVVVILQWKGDASRWQYGPDRRSDLEDKTFYATVGREYRGYAVSVHGDSVQVLIYDDSGLLAWYPMGLFNIANGALPSFWESGYIGNYGDRFQLIFGYSEMVRNPNHYVALMEREPDALEIFEQQTGLTALVNRLMDAEVVGARESGLDLVLENGDAACLGNRRIQQYVDGVALPVVGETISVIVLSGTKYPVPVSSLILDIEP